MVNEAHKKLLFPLSSYKLLL